MIENKMYHQFIKSKKGAVAIETAFMFLILAPFIYFIALYGALGFVYNGKIVETTRQLADYVNKWDNWNFDRTNANKDLNLPDAIDAYRNLLNYASPYYSKTKQPGYNKGSIDHKIYAAYIISGTTPTVTLCATLTSVASPSTGTFPTGAPTLDPQTLSVSGPVWIVQSASRFRGINFTHTAVRRPLGLLLTVAQGGKSYTCLPSMSPITFP